MLSPKLNIKECLCKKMTKCTSAVYNSVKIQVQYDVHLMMLIMQDSETKWNVLDEM
jgi:hypothetical protein